MTRPAHSVRIAATHSLASGAAQFPLQAGTSNDQPSTTTLTVIATNPNQNPDVDTVALNGIVINIPMGDAGSQLCPTQPNTVVTRQAGELRPWNIRRATCGISSCRRTARPRSAAPPCSSSSATCRSTIRSAPRRSI